MTMMIGGVDADGIQEHIIEEQESDNMKTLFLQGFR